ncbi:Meiotic Sister-Chromatid recombination aldehyde dehydrogenase [Cryptotrichosporon argae]
MDCGARLEQLGALTLRDIFVFATTYASSLSVASLIAALYLFDVPFTLSQWWSERQVVEFAWPAPKEADAAWTGRIIESPSLTSHETDASLLPPEAGETGRTRQHLTCYDPSTGAHLTTLPLLDAAGVASQVAAADAAQSTWARTTFAERRRVLRSLRRWVVRDMDAIIAVACRDTGKTRVDAVFGEILTTLSKIDWLIKHGEATLKPERRPGNLLLAHKVSTVHHVPLGTVLALVSWNYSFHNLVSPVLAALFAGDAVVLKCSENVAWSSRWFAGAVRRCLKRCGHDPAVFQLVICLPDVAETLTRNPTIKHITFIGSETVGRKVAAAAADIMVPTCIELGGKDPALILPSADLDFFASTWMRGAFQSAGQNCIGIELFLVPRALYPRFLSIMAPRVSALRLGLDVGALISHAPLARLERLVAAAVAGGARVLAGGRRGAHPDPAHAHGAYFEPTLIADVGFHMDIAREELFAPVMAVVPYDDVEHALTWLNRSRFGLGAGVYGADRDECMRAAERIECGMVAINDFGVFYLNQAMPFGGTKASGHGRFGGPEGLRALTAAKSVIADRWFGAVRTRIPRPVDFPLPAEHTSWAFLQGLVGFVYGEGLARLAALGQLVRAAL